MRALSATLLLALIAAPVGAQAGRSTAPRKARAASPRAGDAGALLRQAEEEIAAGRREEGARLLRQAADSFQSVRALLRLAKLEAQGGDAKGAAESLRRALVLAPNSEDVLFAHAQMALSERALREALFDLEALSRMSPAVSQYHYLLGVALMQAGDMTAAAEALQRAQDAEPDRPLTLIALGFAHNSRRRHQEAKNVLLRSLDFEPDNLEAIAALAEAEEGLGETENARDHAQKVLARIPGHATANLVMGLVLMKEERYAEARDAFLKAADAEAVSAKPHYQLSLAYARLGDEVRAREHLETYQRRQKEIEDRVRELRGLSPVSDGGVR